MPIEIYTREQCPYCERVRNLLRIKGVAFTEYLVNGDPQRDAELCRRGAAGKVPGIFIADRLIGGCTELFELDECGELDRLLAVSPGSPR